MNKKVVDELNKQINREMFSAYLYLSMCAYVENDGLHGMANWMKVQFQEELFHSQMMFDYINERGGRVILDKFDKPQSEWDSVTDVFNAVLKHEQFITESINNLVTIATEEKDYATINFLQWYVKEQVEEEANVNDILDQLKLIQDSKMGLIMLDKSLATRVFTIPSDTTIK